MVKAEFQRQRALYTNAYIEELIELIVARILEEGQQEMQSELLSTNSVNQPGFRIPASGVLRLGQKDFETVGWRSSRAIDNSGSLTFDEMGLKELGLASERLPARSSILTFFAPIEIIKT